MFAATAVPYLWWVLALALIGVEVALPGYFMLWIGFAAAAMGLLTLLAPGLPPLAQAAAFAVLALLSCALYWRAVRPRLLRVAVGAEAALNRRGVQMIGRRYVLAEAIVNGRGKARVGDGLWLVSGPELPAGSTVEVTAVEGTLLVVRAAP